MIISLRDKANVMEELKKIFALLSSTLIVHGIITSHLCCATVPPCLHIAGSVWSSVHFSSLFGSDRNTVWFGLDSGSLWVRVQVWLSVRVWIRFSMGSGSGLDVGSCLDSVLCV